VARGTQHRKRSTRPNARVAAPAPKPKAKRVKHERWEDQLFFARLRNHAKIIFALLIGVFVISFVFLGVGSGSTGVSDALQNFFTRSHSSGSSASSLQKKANEHPKDPTAWRALATKLESDGRLDDAITALKRYTALKPKDQDALQELAGIYLRRAGEEQSVYTDAQTRTRILAPSMPSAPSSKTDLGKALATLTNPLSSTVSQTTSSVGTGAYTAIIQFGTDAVTTYKKLVALDPKNATIQLRLAQVAQGTGDTRTAIKAYEAFIRLAPDDPGVPNAKKTLKQLKAQLAATATPSTTTK
jgi:cytochrome c-type biogenesis protein CcmH/NrfG